MVDANSPLWSAAHVERAALAEELAKLDTAQWATESLCGGWSVEDVVAHLTAAASTSPLGWLTSVLGARFDFDLHNDRRRVEQLGGTPSETLAKFRAVITSTKSALGPVAGWLGEVVVHSEDIRRPLGIVREVPIETTTAVAEFYASRDFAVRSKRMIEGLHVEATDGPFAAGAGHLVQGPTLALVMVMAGRGAFCDDLTGPGVATLRQRCG